MVDGGWVVTITRGRFGEWAQVRNSRTLMDGDGGLVWAWTRRGLRRKVARVVARAERKQRREVLSVRELLGGGCD